MSATVENLAIPQTCGFEKAADAVAADQGDFFAGLIAAPEHQAAIGVIVMGLGIADMQAVRRFAKQGLAAMQIRLIKDSAHHNDLERRLATYDATGVARCRRAMDFLAAKHKVSKFIVMGNCTLANICFNTALAEPRVVGVILTNPYVDPSFMNSVFLKFQQHFFRMESWRRLLTGRMKMPSATAFVSTGRKLSESEALPSTGYFSKDAALPADFDVRLQRLLMERGVRALIVFSKGEPSLYYFRRFYVKVLKSLSKTGLLSFKIAATTSHDFSARDDAALGLNEIVSEWTQNAWTK